MGRGGANTVSSPLGQKCSIPHQIASMQKGLKPLRQGFGGRIRPQETKGFRAFNLMANVKIMVERLGYYRRGGGGYIVVSLPRLWPGQGSHGPCCS